jgi:adenylate kinase
LAFFFKFEKFEFNMNILILGPQGSGKGTQAKLLADYFNLVHIDIGLSLRQVAEEDTELGKELYRIMYEEKALVSDAEIMKVLEEKLKNIPSNQGMVLDGAPRRLGQIELVENVLKKFEREIDNVILLGVSEEESIYRITRRFNCLGCHETFFLGEDINDPEKGCPICGGKVVQRKDDTEEGIKKRLSIFNEETYPVVGYFKDKGVLKEINGMKSKKEVFNDIISKINS